ncbi:MAG: hypothetical protein ABIO70_14930 [Pseudomonadota bacterium]
MRPWEKTQKRKKRENQQIPDISSMIKMGVSGLSVSDALYPLPHHVKSTFFQKNGIG